MMRLTKIFISLFILSSVLCGACFSTEEENFPKIGFVKNNDANLRAGDSVNFESLYRLQKGDPVKIVDKRYSWFKIMLPKGAHLYIKNDYVDLVPYEGAGIVNAMRVNLRAGPGANYSVLGQASGPEKLNVFSEKDGWYEIERPNGTAGWMHSSQLRLGSEGVKRGKR
ncbi:SH3 domain-containing protein [Candidatus Omnitrophota bacterium]